MATEVIQDAAANRFELLVDGQHAGLTDYVVRDDTLIFTHTEVDPAYQNQGLAGELARGALNLVRAESELRVVARCPYIKSWIERHPEYQDLLER